MTSDEKKMLSEEEKTYELPDGNIVRLGTERFYCTEAFFQPSLIGKETTGIHEATWQSIMKCEVDIRPYLYENILLSGGSSMFVGMMERMTEELKKLAPG